MQTSFNRAVARTNRTPSTRRLLAAAIVAALGFAGTARADLYWDADGAGPGAATAPGTWGTNDFWSPSAAGDVATGAWVPGETAVFSAGALVSGAYTVTVNGTQDAAEVRIEEGILTLSGGGITLSGATPSLVIINSATAHNFNSVFTAANQVSFSRIGTGTVNLNLGAANTFSGGIRVGQRMRINANVAGSLGSGTVTVDGIEASITNDVNFTSVTYANDFVLNPLDLADFTTGFAGAGNSSTTATFAGNISDPVGNANPADVIISPTPNAGTTNTNGNGMTIFSGNNSYRGKTIINMAAAGTFRLGSATALPTTTALELGRTNTAQNIGLVDLFGHDISIVSLATNTAVLTGNGIGITNSKSGAADQSTITITGGATTASAAIIGARTSTSLTNVGGAGTNAGTNNISLTMAASHTGKLTLTGANTYAGDTVVDGGTLVAGRNSTTVNTIAGNVIVNSGGTFGSTASIQGNEYGVGGSITLNSGATLAPGISATGLVGTSTVRANSLTANDGSKIDFTLFSAANHDVVELTSGLTLGAGTKTIDVTLVGDPFVATPSNPLVLMTYPGMTGDAFTLGANPDPSGTDFVYALTTEATRVILTAMPTVTTLVWDADAGGAPIADGAGTWNDGSLNFTNIVDNSQTAWNNTNNFNTIIGASATGVGGTIALDGNIRAGGKLTFASVATPYTIGDVGETDTLTVAGGITNNAIGTTINAPLILEASQNFNVGAGGNTLTVNGTIGEATAGLVLTKTGGGTLTINGATNIGGLSVTDGMLHLAGTATVTSATVSGSGTLVPLSGGVLGSTPINISNNGTLRANVPITLANDITVGTGGATFNVQSGADSTFSGIISGEAVTKAASGKLTLTGSNTFNGLTIGGMGGGVAVGTNTLLGVGPLGAGSITINNGNTLRAFNNFTTDNNIITASGDNNSNIDTAGFTVTLSGVISGTGDLLYRGGGRLVLSGANVNTGNVEIIDPGGILETQSLSAIGTRDLIVKAAGTLEVTSELNMRDIVGEAATPMSLTKTGAANVSVRRVRDIDTLAIDAGTVTVKPLGTATGMSILKSLTIAPGAKLNVSDNDFIVDYTDASPEFTLRDYVKAIYQGGTSGIAYTAGAGDVSVAIAEKTEWGFSDFNGTTLDDTSIVGKYTYFGDANLDGKVTSDDYVAVDVGLGVGDSWVQGDFNFSGTVTSDDYVAIDVNLGKGTPTPLAWAELKSEMVALHTAMFGDAYVQKLAIAEADGYAALVPEPGSLSLLGFGAAGLVSRRRRAARA